MKEIEITTVDDKGLLTEGAGSAFFGIIKGALRTSSLKANILPSITRKFVLPAANNIGLKVVEKSLKVSEAAKADELFLAITTRDIAPVVKFDDKIITGGKPGRWTIKLIEEFGKFTS